MMKTTAHKSASAKALADRKYHQRIVMSKKGKLIQTYQVTSAVV